MRKWWVGVLWLAGLCAAVAQELPGPITLTPTTAPLSLDNRSLYWIDPTAQVKVEQLEAGEPPVPWALRGTHPQYNIDGKALWFQFDAVTPPTGHWFLELASSGVDRAQLFYRGADGQWVRHEAGDSKAVSDWPLPGRFPTFELAGRRGDVVRYWLRVEHARVNFATPLNLYNLRELAASREREQFLLGAYFGLAALIVLVSLANAVVYRDRNFAAYATYVFALSAGQLAYLGVGAQHIWNEWLRWNEVATFILPGVSSAVGLWFVRMVTEPARFSRHLDLAVWALILAVLSSVALDTVLTSRASFAVVMVLTVLSLAVVMVLIGLVWAQGDDPAIRLIALGFMPVVLLALFPLARGMNLIPTSALTRYGLSIGAMLEMPILFYALSLRGTLRRETQVRAASLSRTDPLTGLADNRTLMRRLDGALARAASQGHSCALLVVRLANLDSMVLEHGRETGDRALVLATSLLRHVVTDVDLVARVGEQQFALLLDGPTTDLAVQACATRVVASGLRESEALPGGVTLRFHVAAAILPDGQRDAASSLKWLQEVVAEMARDTRKSIRAMNF
ncbi:MAG: GGDEF domain-containing protein [Ramlibacter sp.]|nr:GGDEF domain-containing protein [Ramlibacter sp.]